MSLRESSTGAIWLMAGGFLAIIVLCWLNELVNPFGEAGEAPNIFEALYESLVVLLVAIPSLILLRRSLRRLDYLENLLSVCAWCKKVEHEGKWIPLSEYFKIKFHTETTHGICTSCLESEQSDLAQRRASILSISEPN